jgi:hypothetical protein
VGPVVPRACVVQPVSVTVRRFTRASRLNDVGLAQAKRLQSDWLAAAASDRSRALVAPHAVDVVLSSPLTRTLQTASVIFSGASTFLAVELCREAYGINPVRGWFHEFAWLDLYHYFLRLHAFEFQCDRRRPLTEVMPEFPHVDFTGGRVVPLGFLPNTCSIPCWVPMAARNEL